MEARGVRNQHKAARPGRACRDIKMQRRRPLQPEWRLSPSQALGPREGVEQVVLYTYGVQRRGNDEGVQGGRGIVCPPPPGEEPHLPVPVSLARVSVRSSSTVRLSRACIARMVAVVTRPWLGWEWAMEGSIR